MTHSHNQQEIHQKNKKEEAHDYNNNNFRNT
jgi:hypothetical protein